MVDFNKVNFYNPTKGNLKFDGVVEEVFDYIKEQNEQGYEIIVGCDSCSGEKPAFPVVLVVLRKGQGGRFFLAKVNYANNNRIFHTLRQRILEEVYLSCDFALNLKGAIKNKIASMDNECDYEFEYIHADVGGSEKTRAMIKEVVGLIRSNGFTPKVKPESFVASIVADRFT